MIFTDLEAWFTTPGDEMGTQWKRLADEQPEERETVLLYYEVPDEGSVRHPGFFDLAWLHVDGRMIRPGGIVAATPPYLGWWWTELPAPPPAGGA